jgi:hypothetical protein
MTPFVTAGAAFLLAVLWFDLMFDVQGLRHRSGVLPEDVLASIAGYYRRVTTLARPMNRLVALVMLGTLVAIVVQLARDDTPKWLGWVSLAFVAGAVVLAMTRTVPNAVRLGARDESLGQQTRRARGILADHVVCLVAIATVLGLQLAFGR